MAIRAERIMIETSEALREENERLRLRIKELEQRLSRYEPQDAAASEGLCEREPRIPYQEVFECRHSQSTTPAANRSARRSTVPRWICSGER